MLTSIAMILLLGLLIGWLFNKIKLPSLLGMIVVGMILSPYALNLIDDLDQINGVSYFRLVFTDESLDEIIASLNQASVQFTATKDGEFISANIRC